MTSNNLKQVTITIEVPMKDSEVLLKCFATYYNTTSDNILYGFKTIEFSRRKGLFFYLLFSMLDYSKKEISVEFNIKRTTIISAINVVEFEINKYSQLRKDMRNILHMFEQLKESVGKLSK